MRRQALSLRAACARRCCSLRRRAGVAVLRCSGAAARARRQRADAEDARRPRSRRCARDRGHRGQRGAGDRRLPQVPRDRAARAAARRGDAPPRRPRDGRWPTTKSAQPAARRPTTRRRSRATRTSSRPIRTTRATTACSTSSRAPTSRAATSSTALKTLDRLVKDYPHTPLPRRGPVPPRRAAVHRARTTRRPRRPSPPCSRAARPSRTTTARSTCRAGRSSSRPGSRTRLRSFFAVLDLKLAGEEGEGGIETSPA